MIKIPMSRSEFDVIEKQLQNLNPGEGIMLRLPDPSRVEKGNIVGTHPIGWSADFYFEVDGLTIIGHGNRILGIPGKVEDGLKEKLEAALDEMRSSGPKAA